MKYYSTNAACSMIIRKKGHYMSVPTAKRIAGFLRFVFDDSTEQPVDVIIGVLCGFLAEDSDDRALYGFTPSEQKIMFDLVRWFADETSSAKGIHSFVVANLNAGRTFVITERFERKTTSLS